MSNEHSPYMPSEALSVAAQRHDIISNQTLKNVIIANPDVLNDLDFVRLLREKENPMSETDMEEILSHKGDITERTIQEEELATAITEMQKMANVVLSYLYQEQPINLEAIRLWQRNKKSLHGDYAIAGTYFKENNYVAGLLHLHTMTDRFELNDQQQFELNRYIELIEFQQRIFNAGRTMENLEQDEIAYLQTFILDYPERSSVYIQELLNFYYNYGYDWRILELPLEDENIQTAPSKQLLIIDNNIPTKDKITAFPNPAKTIVNFVFSNAEIIS